MDSFPIKLYSRMICTETSQFCTVKYWQRWPCAMPPERRHERLVPCVRRVRRATLLSRSWSCCCCCCAHTHISSRATSGQTCACRHRHQFSSRVSVARTGGVCCCAVRVLMRVFVCVCLRVQHVYVCVCVWDPCFRLRTPFRNHQHN